VTPQIGATPQAPQVFASAATSEVIGGLSAGAKYTFTVSATNVYGTGSPSSASRAVTITP